MDGCFRIGPEMAIQVLVVEPLFEEANRMRRTLTSVMRGLARHGIGSILPDLPGTGESLTEIAEVRLADLQAAVKDVADRVRGSSTRLIIASFRGGALIDARAQADSWWRCAPETGSRLVRDLKRTQMASNDKGERLKLAGHALSPDFIAELEAAIPTAVQPVRTVRLATDAAEADAKIVGSPLWRRAEPGEDPQFCDAIVADLVEWSRTCVAA